MRVRLAAVILFSIPVAFAQQPRARIFQLPKLPEPVKRHALLIGIDEYQDPHIAKLSGAANDAVALSEALISNAGFAPAQVTRISSNEGSEGQPTRSNILRVLSRLKREVPRDGLLLVSFSGHGIEREGKAYLMPSDAVLAGDISLLEDTALDVSMVASYLRDVGAAQMILIVDACRSDPLANRGGAGNVLTPAFVKNFNFAVQNQNVQAFAILYATAEGTNAYEYPQKKMGYFTWALTEGIRGAAANRLHQVTLAGLVNYVENVVPQRTFVDVGKKQQPFSRIEGYKADSLVISVAGPQPILPVQPTIVEPLLPVESERQRQDNQTPPGPVNPPPPKPTPQNPADGRLVVASDRSSSVYEIRLLFDNRIEARLRPGGSTEVHLPPGQHTVQTFATDSGAQWLPMGNPARINVPPPPATSEAYIVQPSISNGMARWLGMQVSR
jgi:hypothetical protein